MRTANVPAVRCARGTLRLIYASSSGLISLPSWQFGEVEVDVLVLFHASIKAVVVNVGAEADEKSSNRLSLPHPEGCFRKSRAWWNFKRI